MPATNAAFWSSKFERNRARDIRKEALLKSQGWEVMTIWECEVRDATQLAARLVEFLGTTKQKDSFELLRGVPIPART